MQNILIHEYILYLALLNLINLILNIVNYYIYSGFKFIINFYIKFITHNANCTISKMKIS
jgi:hypothetical protein